MNLAGLIGGQHLSGGGNRVQLIACTSNIDAVHMARRRAVLAQFLAEAEPGIRLCEHIEDVDGAVVFRQACVMGLEGVVAKRRDSRYRSGRCREEGGREGYVRFVLVIAIERRFSASSRSTGVSREPRPLELPQRRSHMTIVVLGRHVSS